MSSLWLLFLAELFVLSEPYEDIAAEDMLLKTKDLQDKKFGVKMGNQNQYTKKVISITYIPQV